MTAQENDILKFIREEINRVGPIPFSRYMEICLYHNTSGYYSKPGPKTGREGDFYTAPHVHLLFGKTISRWLSATLQKMGISHPKLLELGPGGGQLAEDILESWPEDTTEPGLMLVEASAYARSLLEDRLKDYDVVVYPPEDWAGLPEFSGAVIANEFFDALPLRLLERKGDNLLEVHVKDCGDCLEETLLPVQHSSLDTAVLELAGELLPDNRLEFAPESRSWLLRLGRKLKSGIVMILDYGDTFDGLNAQWRTGGTLRCYRRHRVEADPLTDPGGMDITAHVNFTLLRDWATEAGFTVNNYTTQSSFLIRAGILDLLTEQLDGRKEDPEAIREWLAVKNLIHDEGGMGEIFKVIVLKKQ